MLKLAEEVFEVLVTVDKSIQYQQNFTNQQLILVTLSAAATVMETFKKFNNPVSVLEMESTNKLKILMQRVSELSKMERPKPWLRFGELPKMELPKPLFLDTIKNIDSNENEVRHIEALLDLGLERERLQFFQDYDDCVINDITTITEHRANFNNAIADIKKIFNTSIDSTIENCLYRLLYANVIAALETYLSDAFINTVLSNPSFVHRLVETTPKFKEEKIIFSDIYKSISNIEGKVRKYLTDFILKSKSSTDTKNI